MSNGDLDERINQAERYLARLRWMHIGQVQKNR